MPAVPAVSNRANGASHGERGASAGSCLISKPSTHHANMQTWHTQMFVFCRQLFFFFLEIVPSVLSSVKFFMLTLYNSVWMDVRIHVYCIYVLFDFIFNMDGVYGFLFYS